MAKRKNPHAPFWIMLEAYERKVISSAIKETGTITAAAKALGIDRTYLNQRLRHLGIDKHGDVTKKAHWLLTATPPAQEAAE